MPRKRKISWDTIGIAIQITVGVIEIAILIYQCVTSNNEDEQLTLEDKHEKEP